MDERAGAAPQSVLVARCARRFATTESHRTKEATQPEGRAMSLSGIAVLWPGYGSHDFGAESCAALEPFVERQDTWLMFGPGPAMAAYVAWKESLPPRTGSSLVEASQTDRGDPIQMRLSLCMTFDRAAPAGVRGLPWAADNCRQAAMSMPIRCRAGHGNLSGSGWGDSARRLLRPRFFDMPQFSVILLHVPFTVTRCICEAGALLNVGRNLWDRTAHVKFVHSDNTGQIAGIRNGADVMSDRHQGVNLSWRMGVGLRDAPPLSGFISRNSRGFPAMWTARALNYHLASGPAGKVIFDLQCGRHR